MQSTIASYLTEVGDVSESSFLSGQLMPELEARRHKNLVEKPYHVSH